MLSLIKQLDKLMYPFSENEPDLWRSGDGSFDKLADDVELQCLRSVEVLLPLILQMIDLVRLSIISSELGES